MPSSTSSSEPGRLDEAVYERPLPALDAARVMWVALVLVVAGIAGWEAYWRGEGSVPGYRNSDGQWAIQRRRLDHGEGGKTIITGSSRMLFDVQLPVWERVTGERPIQLALEGTTPLPVLENLADDPDVTGRILVGVAPDLFFNGFESRRKAIARYRDETPSQRAGEWLSMTFVEPWFAFYDPDFALGKVLERRPWPRRAGVPHEDDVRKLSISARDRHTWMWSRVERDTAWATMSQRVWAQWFDLPELAPDSVRVTTRREVDRAVKAVAKLRARGAQVIFVRAPSDADYLAFEERAFPRAETWDRLLRETGAPGIHFQDYPELQGYWLPEWSHMSRAEAERFTAALAPIVERVSAAHRKGG